MLFVSGQVPALYSSENQLDSKKAMEHVNNLNSENYAVRREARHAVMNKREATALKRILDRAKTKAKNLRQGARKRVAVLVFGADHDFNKYEKQMPIPLRVFGKRNSQKRTAP